MMFAKDNRVRSNENPFHTRVTQATATATGVVPHEDMMIRAQYNTQYHPAKRYVASLTVGAEEYGKFKISANDPLFIVLDSQKHGQPGDTYPPPLSVCSSVAGLAVPDRIPRPTLSDLRLEFVGYSVAENIFAKVGQPHPDIGIYISGAVTIFNNGPEFINANTELCYVPPPTENILSGSSVVPNPEYEKLIAELEKNDYVYRAQPILKMWTLDFVDREWDELMTHENGILYSGVDDSKKIEAIGQELTNILAAYQPTIPFASDRERVDFLKDVTGGRYGGADVPRMVEAVQKVRRVFEHNSRRQVIGRSLTHAFPGEQLDIILSTAV